MTLRYRGFALIGLLSVIAACSSDKTTGVNGNVSGSVSFTYSGAGQTNATYAATGAISSTTSSSAAYTKTWAAAYKDNADQSTNLVANLVRGSKSDLLVITMASQSTGNTTIDSNCNSTSTTACTDVVLAIGVSSDGSNFDYVCVLESGSVSITSLSGSNAQGTFSGAGTCTQTVQPFATSTWTVTNGSFNVPVLASPPQVGG
ncbi:MAG TPA: hypothetical protein VJ867_04910 [Gemmatimonadaceae bacterium]|nr:hypothetical protein [Gemmatimonadaceae bacterium]